MFAPTSGEELRSQIRMEADAKTQKFHANWQKGLHEMNAPMAKIQTDISQIRDKGIAEA